ICEAGNGHSLQGRSSADELINLFSNQLFDRIVHVTEEVVFFDTNHQSLGITTECSHVVVYRNIDGSGVPRIETSDGLQRCRGVLNALGHWTDVVQRPSKRIEAVFRHPSV